MSAPADGTGPAGASALPAEAGWTVPLLAVNGLSVSFPTPQGRVDAVRGVSFEVRAARSSGS